MATNHMTTRTYFRTLVIVLFVGALFAQFPRALAIPYFARKYQTSCMTCHSDPPELNDFGVAFKKNGFKFPEDDETYVKQPQQMLGAPAQKQVFPETVWPGELPATIPMGLRFEGYTQFYSKQPLALGFQPRVDLFAPDTFTAIAAGSYGPALSFWLDDDISTGGSGADGGLGDAYLKFNDLGRYFHLPKDTINVRFGQFELDLPFTQARTINLSDYDIYDEAAVAGDLGTTDNPFVLGAPQRGIEVGGYPNDGNFNWSLAVTNGSNDGTPTSNGKNIYFNVYEQFNLERNPQDRKAIQASGPTGPHDHTSLRLGGFYDYGRNSINTDLSLFPDFGAISEPYYRTGGYFRFKYQSRFELYGMGMFSHDDNLLPNLDTLTLEKGPDVNFSGGFAQAELWLYPWLIPIMRYDVVNSPADFFNGASRRTTRNRFSPGLQALVRPNIKLVFEYQHTFEQPVPDSDTFFRASGAQGGIDISF
jgi:hypothetical protein